MMKRIKSRLAAVSLMVFAAMLMAVPAFATTPSDIETVIQGGFDDVTSLLTGTIAVAFFAITLVVLGIAVGVRWLRRGAKQG